MEIELDQARIEAMMLAGVRIVAFLVIAPPFANRAIPARQNRQRPRNKK